MLCEKVTCELKSNLFAAQHDSIVVMRLTVTEDCELVYWLKFADCVRWHCSAKGFVAIEADVLL